MIAVLLIVFFAGSFLLAYMIYRNGEAHRAPEKE